MGLQFSHSSCPQNVTSELSEQGIVDNLTQNNRTRPWGSRRFQNDDLYTAHVPSIDGTGFPTTLVVKKFQNINPALQVDDNVKNRCRSEMILLANIGQDNIIKVLDVIERDEAIMLVYKYEVNRNLDYWLHQRDGADRLLSWPKRMAVAIGTAKGLCHLHHGCNKPIVHHNINSNNILLGQKFKAVIASFGAAQMNMAGLGQPLPITDLHPGNVGYAAPEYCNVACQLTEKVDVYSFGVVLLELVTGRVACGAGPNGLLATWARRSCNELMASHLERFKTEVDQGIPDQARYIKEMATVFRLGVDCTAEDPQKRPSMQLALKRLRRSCGHGPLRNLTCYLM